MVTLPRKKSERAALMAELMAAMGVMVIALIPLGFAFVEEQKLCRAYYQRAVLVEILDGEMEVLAAGLGRSEPDGTRAFQPRGEAVTNLPPGNFTLTKEGRRLRLEWLPASGRKPLAREALLP